MKTSVVDSLPVWVVWGQIVTVFIQNDAYSRMFMCFLEVILGHWKQNFALKNTFLENNICNFFFSSTYCGRYWVNYIVWVVPRQKFTLTNHTIIKVIWIDRTKLPPTSNSESRLFQLNVYIIQTKQITTLV